MRRLITTTLVIYSVLGTGAAMGGVSREESCNGFGRVTRSLCTTYCNQCIRDDGTNCDNTTTETDGCGRRNCAAIRAEFTRRSGFRFFPCEVVGAPTATATATATATHTPIATFTATSTPEGTATETPLPTNTPPATATATETAIATFTATSTPQGTATETPVATDTPAQPTATATNTLAAPTATPSSTPVAPTASPTGTRTATTTVAPSSTATRTNTSVPSATPTGTRTATNTVAPPNTATPTNTLVPSATTTRTHTPTSTPIPTNTGTPTNTMPAATATPASVVCNFDEAGATDISDLDLRVQGNSSLGGLVGDIQGSISVSCGAAGANGKRSCTCDLESWTPANITGIGFVCIFPASGCPAGEVDCDGGNQLGVDSFDDQQIGTCTGHADCSTQCDTYCGGLGKVQWRSGCENFCQGGTRDGQACICDSASGGGCSGGMAGVNDCPNGSCVGKNNEADTDCQCQCIDYTAGGPSEAGDIQCNLGSDLKVVGSLPCTNPALVDLPPVCFPLTSQTITGQTVDANENAGATIGPNTSTGTPETCANFDAGSMAGYQIVTDVGFMDSTIGDLRALLRADCQ